MKSVSLCAGGLLLALCASVSPASAADVNAKPAADASCHLYRAAHYDLLWGKFRQPEIKITLNGTEELFGISTLSTFSSINSDAASSLGLKIRTLRFTGSFSMYDWHGKQFVPQIANVKNVQLGALPLSDMKFIVSPNTSGETRGLIGPDFLGLFDVEYDPEASQLSLFMHNKCPSRVVHWTNGPRSVLSWQATTELKCDHAACSRGAATAIVLPAKLDGKDVFVRFATNMPASAIYTEDAKTLLSQEQMKNLVEIPDGETPDGKMYKFPAKELNLDGIKIQEPNIIIMPYNRYKTNHIVYKRPLIILGDSVLNKLHFYISYAEQKVYITAADAH